MPNSWIEALKKWNEGKGMWCLPKKGTKDYEEVRALMPPKAAKAKAPKLPKAEKGEKPDDEEQQLLAEARSAVKQQKKAKGAAKRGYDEMVKETLSALDLYREQKKAKAAAPPPPPPAPPKAKRAIKIKKGAKEAVAEEKKEEGRPQERWSAAADAAAEEFMKKTKSKSSSYIKSRMNAIKKKVYAREKAAYEEKVRAIIAQRKNK